MERHRRSLTKKQGLIDFASNDYLGFARSQELVSRIKNAFHRTGSTGSRLLTGNSEEAERLEKEIADFHEAESSLLFSTGYMANLALYSTALKRENCACYDEECHASIRDGIRLSYAKHYSFRHNDLDSLEYFLKRHVGAYIAVESIYSISGQICPLLEICELAEKYKAKVIVDEAHGFGFYEKGLVQALGLEKSVFARTMTFGKALGVAGAAVLGSTSLQALLINAARPFIYSTAPPFYQLAAIQQAYKLYEHGDQQKRALRTLCERAEVDSPIQFLPCENAKAISLFLEQKGFDVRPLFPPTTKEGGLRIQFHAYNTIEEVSTLWDLLSSEGVPPTWVNPLSRQFV